MKMAEKKTVSVSESGRKKKTAAGGATMPSAKATGSATPKRIGAVILWILAIALEVVAILMVGNKIIFSLNYHLWFIIGAIVLDLICVVAGSLLWKSANLIDPASEKNKVKFWLWNNMGLIVSIFAFVPLIVLLLANKDKLDAKTRIIAIVAAVIALLIGGLASYDFNPVSQEGKTEAEQEITGNVYWTQFGKVYHLDSDCQHIAKSDYYEGTVKEAIESNRVRLCKTCAAKHPDVTFVNDDVVED